MGEKLEAGEHYRGPCGLLKDSNWLTAESLPSDKDTIVTIEAVVVRKNVAFKNETKRLYGSLRFVGKEKELGVNATHLKVLSTLFGKDTANWYGQKVALYVDKDVMAFGQKVSAVRIRAKRIEQSKGAASKPEPEPTEAEKSFDDLDSESEHLERDGGGPRQ